MRFLFRHRIKGWAQSCAIACLFFSWGDTVRADFCTLIADFATGGRYSRGKTHAADELAQLILDPASSPADKLEALQQLGEVSNYQARASALKKLIPAALESGSPMTRNPALLGKFVEALQRQLSRTLVSLQRDRVIPAFQRNDLYSSLRHLYFATNVFGAALLNNEGATPMVSKSRLLSCLDSDVFAVLREAGNVTYYLAHKRDPRQLGEVTDGILSAMKKEAANRDRQEVRILLETLLNEVLRNVNKSTDFASVAERLAGMMTPGGYVDVDELQALAANNQAGNEIGGRIEGALGADLSDEELLRRIAALKRSDGGRAQRAKLERYENWARSGQPELVHQARSFVAMMEH
jgi:hypothetical protein